MAHIREALRTLRDDDPSQRIAGARFEHVVRDALLAHPGEYGKERFAEVWLWADWPEREDHGYPRMDSGIDLVARQTESWDGGFCAIQCKYGETQVSTQEIDSFLAGSEGIFLDRLLVTSRDIAQNGLDKLKRAEPHCVVLRTAQMDDWVDDWRPVIAGDVEIESIDLPKHEPRPYQIDALEAIEKGFASHDKGQLILPCGTGKSFVALRAAEQEVGVGSTVLYLVPSIALMGQTMQEWARHQQEEESLEYLGVCSDVTTGRRSGPNSDISGDLTELAMPITTDAARLAERLGKPPASGKMRVVFSTYQSTPKIAEALALLGDDHGFDLIICDEAHRTTGLSEATNSAVDSYEDVSPFLLVHRNEYLPAAKRLFMTATPRVFTERVRSRLEQDDFDGDSYSMDDKDSFGPEFYRMSFAAALDGGWLADYEVLVIAASEMAYMQALSDQNMTPSSEVSLDTAVKLGGCWDGLATPMSTDKAGVRPPGQIDLDHGGPPARSAIAFCNKVSTSKKIADLWAQVTSTIAGKHSDPAQFLTIEVDHLDGTTPANQRADLLHQLREHAAEVAPEADQPTVCRVLTNARVLSEGVDVPALDAVVFLESRKSPIDITQAVGRAMRTAEGKERGYIIIPVVVPDFGEGDADALARNILANGDFKPVWEVVRALRSHDDRIDYWLNNPTAARVKAPFSLRVHDPTADDSDGVANLSRPLHHQLQLELNEQFASMLVETCGDKRMYPNWGQRAARICGDVHIRVEQLVSTNTAAAAAFDEFLERMREAISPDLDHSSALEMVAQHVVTIPVFDEMFSKSQFAERNPVSKSIERLLARFAQQGAKFDEELQPLSRAYKTMRDAFEGAVTGGEKLDILKEIYDGFFKAAMSDEVSRLGIVYTPVELVDFVLQLVDSTCRAEFGKGLTDEDVNVLDPFAGTGTFLNRLLTLEGPDGQPLIRDEDVARKYQSELHANEIVLLAYYIAALKIEEAAAERDVFSADSYQEFEGVVLTDTYLMGDDAMHRQLGLDPYLQENSDRAKKQNSLHIQVIVGNPPWSAGQKSAGDDNPNTVYDDIGERVRETYGRRHKEVTGRAAGPASGNLYVEAFRWASDRLIGQENNSGFGVLAFIHPNSLSTGTSLAGMRAALRDEFTSIYVVNLRGDAYKSGDEARKEGDVIFPQGSRNAVQITLLVRNPNKNLNQPAELHYAEVPEYSSLDDKFSWLAQFGGVTSEHFKTVPLNDRHHWVNLTDGTFSQLLQVCSTENQEANAVVRIHALGLKTNCDTYVYSFSRNDLIDKIKRLIATYEDARLDIANGIPVEKATRNDQLDVIKWTHVLKQSAKRGHEILFDESRIRPVLYRPFTQLWLYEDDRILSQVRAISAMFPRDIALTMPPPRSSSPPQPTEQYSQPWPPDASPTSAPQEPTNQHDSSLGTRPSHDRPVQYGDLRHTGDTNASRPTRDGSRPTDADAASSHQTPALRGGGNPGQSHQSPPLRSHRHQPPLRPRCHWATDPSFPSPAILITGTSNMTFQALATTILPDLASIKGSRQTRALPRRRSS